MIAPVPVHCFSITFSNPKLRDLARERDLSEKNKLSLSFRISNFMCCIFISRECIQKKMKRHNLWTIMTNVKYFIAHRLKSVLVNQVKIIDAVRCLISSFGSRKMIPPWLNASLYTQLYDTYIFKQ